MDAYALECKNEANRWVGSIFGSKPMWIWLRGPRMDAHALECKNEANRWVGSIFGSKPIWIWLRGPRMDAYARECKTKPFGGGLDFSVRSQFAGSGSGPAELLRGCRVIVEHRDHLLFQEVADGLGATNGRGA